MGSIFDDATESIESLEPPEDESKSYIAGFEGFQEFVATQHDPPSEIRESLCDCGHAGELGVCKCKWGIRTDEDLRGIFDGRQTYDLIHSYEDDPDLDLEEVENGWMEALRQFARGVGYQ